jgi:hypothetical protein
MTTQIRITTEQYKAAEKEIREWFPGKNNTGLRATLRKQLSAQVQEIQGRDQDPYWTVRVKLGYGTLLLNGSGDERTQNFNADVNSALGL